MKIFKTVLWAAALLLVCFAAVLLAMSVKQAAARDLGQWDKIDPQIKDWFSSLMQPDTVRAKSPVSCCGEGDAYWADVATVRDGKLFATITDDRPDGPLMRLHEEPGTEFEVLPEKVVGMEQKIKGNPTGHIVIFLGTNAWVKNQRHRWVLCYVENGGV